jgi:hypothetical protein
VREPRSWYICLHPWFEWAEYWSLHPLLIAVSRISFGYNVLMT